MHLFIIWVTSKYILKIAKFVARCFWKQTLLGESEKVLNLANKISKLATLDRCHDKFSLIEFHLNQWLLLVAHFTCPCLTLLHLEEKNNRFSSTFIWILGYITRTFFKSNKGLLGSLYGWRHTNNMYFSFIQASTENSKAKRSRFNKMKMKSNI